MWRSCLICLFFFFNDTATTEIYTLSLHDALPICTSVRALSPSRIYSIGAPCKRTPLWDWSTWMVSRRCQECRLDRKSTRLNSSHANISYAVFCLKKKRTKLPSLLLIILAGDKATQ